MSSRPKIPTAWLWRSAAVPRCKLTKFLESQGVRILGTSADSIDRAEDRERFDELLEELNIKRPKGAGVMTEEEAIAEAHRLDYPVLLRPSYVLGGQNMIIAFSDEDVHEYMKIILSHKQDNPVLIDKYLMGIEVEVDAISDGKDILIPGIMEHIERAGIHSGDSIAVYPPRSLNGDITRPHSRKQPSACSGAGYARPYQYSVRNLRARNLRDRG